MSDFEIVPEHPAELAALRAEEMAMASTEFAISDADERQLAELEYAADELGFLGRSYFVQANRGLAIPVGWNDGERVTYINFMGVSFEGNFATYGKVVVGRLIGRGAVRALCLTFDNVTVLPCFEKLPDDHLLYVPALAVSSMDHYEAA